MPTTPTWKSTLANLWSKSQSAAQWRLPFALFICAMLAYGAALAWHMLANFDLINFIRDANYDDSFYYFQIAYNLSQGKFSTFDGGITQTNGYHPVWMLLITPFYWVLDKETALFAIKTFEIMLVAGGVALIALAAWLSRLAWPLMFAALPMLYYRPVKLLWGMEAAAALFTLSLLILVVCLYMRSPERWKWTLAAIAFALPWVRIEYIAVSLAVTAALCAIEWSRQERRALNLSALANIPHAYIPLIGAAAGILVYFAYNRLAFGSVLPVNALTKQAWSQYKWASEGGYDFIQNFGDMLQLGIFGYELLIAFEICAYLLLVWRLALRSKERRDWLLLAFIVGVFGLAAGHIAKFAQSVLIMHPSDTDKIWYFVPAYLMAALIIPVRLYVAIYLIRRFLAPRWRTAANALSVSVFVIGAALLLARSDFAEPFRWVDQKSNSIERNWYIGSYMGVQVINRALPEGSVIGSWDAGVIGYFSSLPVVSLDGLVNSYDYLRSRSIQHTLAYANSVEDLNFYRRYGITHFANVRWWRHHQINTIFEGAPLDPPNDTRHFKIWTYDLASETQDRIDYPHQVWERLQPRFDYSSDGVGVVLAGRTAQAFAKDCPPDEPLTWTWSEPKHERIVSTETVPYRNSANICVASRVLPRSAGSPAQAAMMTSRPYANVDFEDISDREPIIRSDFDVYLMDGSLIYAKSECAEADIEARFFANIFPAQVDDLIEKGSRRNYDIMTFNFHDNGAIDDDERCLAALDLPRYPIAKIQAGQYIRTADGYPHIWDGIYDESVHRATVEVDFELLAGRKPIIRSDFDVYLIDGRLIYTKAQCSEADVEARFFASAFPVDANDLTERHMQRGYYARDFDFNDYGAISDGRCWAAVDLPKYPIAEIHAGQYMESADGYSHIWVGTYDESVHRATVEADFELLAERDPIIRSHFDVYLLDNRLIYTRADCSQEDTIARFYVSISPFYADDLPDNRAQHGYDAIEFNFHDHGATAADGQCLTETNIPNYPIAELRTGQYVELADGYDYLWRGTYRFE